MKFIKSAVLIGISVAAAQIPAVAKDKVELSPLQLQAMQTKDFEASKETVFASVMSVLQDAGYRVENADLATGIITGVGSSKGKMVYSLWSGFGKSKKSPIVSSYIEQLGPMTRVRLNFVMAKVKSTLYGSQPQDEEPIVEAAVYQDAFNKIDQALFIRSSMTQSAPKAAEASAAVPASPPASGE
ncbi:MAG: hypothetical protein ACTHJU_04040 [Sphingopyxis sp.]